MNRIENFIFMKQKNEKITMLTAYDYPSGLICASTGIDVILVGDSSGMVVQGKKTTIGVTIEDIIRYGQAVRKGAPESFVLVDMPYMSFHLDVQTSKKNAGRIMIETQANAVKIEGGTKNRIQTIAELIDCEIPVCGHLGLTPQSINRFGEYKVQAKSNNEQNDLLEQAIEIEKAGAFMLVLECVPEELGATLAAKLRIPVIGIGAGRYTDGQVMVWHDILGLSEMTPKFVKKYIDLKQIITSSVNCYVQEVKTGDFPHQNNVYYPMTKTPGTLK